MDSDCLHLPVYSRGFLKSSLVFLCHSILSWGNPNAIAIQLYRTRLHLPGFKFPYSGAYRGQPVHFIFLPPRSTLLHAKQCRTHSNLLLLDTHPLCGLSCLCAEVAQVVEQRTENSKPGVPLYGFTYKIDQLPHPGKTCFQRRILFRHIVSFSV